MAEGSLLGGRYRLESRVGAGGMGVVYRAADEKLGRTVAIKLFRDSEAADLRRKTSETRLLASLNHPSLVTLYDALIDGDGEAYLVMEFVDGPTLRSRLSDGPLGPVEAARMAHELGEALHVVHQAGIVHRDIKPANVLLRRSVVASDEFTATLADFGIAHLIGASRLTTPGTLLGTAAYLSPEQVQGSEPAPSSDIYALGLVLLESLTGERVFGQPVGHEAALARLTNDPEVPGELGYGWKSLLTAMTARDPEQRPAALEIARLARELRSESAPAARSTESVVTAAMTEAPTEAMADEPTLVMTDAPTRVMTEAAVEPPKRRRRAVLITALAAAVVLVTALTWVLSTIPTSTPAPASTPTTTSAPATPEPEPVPSDDAPSTSEPLPEPVAPDTGPGNGNGNGNSGNGKGNGNGNSGNGNPGNGKNK
ncbi:serine/threonine-protein kinase [Agreia sp. VKM Ac-1783]|uniref:serine/threonine-protein kinase n=1 Tax=Agreia sp. VKM Ac-1783 TaxID=1938889 RepID=UPI000A2AED5D|nr:serine/threonine-protein kinase [Agreia sp. VKM Ac-1783]SMQ71305.1 Serine/threonine protein kinase [Agreia sp. VKM Ac-1783]